MIASDKEHIRYRIVFAFQMKRDTAKVTICQDAVIHAKIAIRDFVKETLSLKIEKAMADLRNSKTEHLSDQREKESAARCSYFHK